ncbi:type VII toxin-antitoxin system MntA family adenylyltransferase antitoxin [Psychrilyobacter atlanticus]|uniref:type VII toxin-antitoxin system MntA family adenylyltransferase antitoxin n=1 Tax=Psychrilyobacter atlanticus TaxID=271091 RepID=UPI0004029E87|nr:nucleotidyltransferase domain-containing protein [Psychrilyobacter atlanticus]
MKENSQFISKEKVQDYIKKIMKYFSDKEKNIDGVYIFGSISRGEMREESDIDIAVIGNFNFYDRLDFICDLEKKLGKKIDLIDFNGSNLNFQAEIITNGELIYCLDREKNDLLEYKILAKYLVFEEDRKIVLDEIYKRGSVFNEKSGTE